MRFKPAQNMDRCARAKRCAKLQSLAVTGNEEGPRAGLRQRLRASGRAHAIAVGLHHSGAFGAPRLRLEEPPVRNQRAKINGEPR
jgi:hypothetical protein